jgi:hypothetical protein
MPASSMGSEEPSPTDMQVYTLGQMSVVRCSLPTIGYLHTACRRSSQNSPSITTTTTRTDLSRLVNDGRCGLPAKSHCRLLLPSRFYYSKYTNPSFYIIIAHTRPALSAWLHQSLSTPHRLTTHHSVPTNDPISHPSSHFLFLLPASSPIPHRSATNPSAVNATFP